MSRPTAGARSRTDRWVAEVVAEHTGLTVHDVVVTRACPVCAGSDHGRPVVLLPGTGRRPPSVSLSRAGGLTVLAVTDDGPVGVDVQAVPDAPVPDFASFALHPAERAGTAEEQCRTWVRKEALLKALGTGLRTDPRGVRLSAPGAGPEVLEWPAEEHDVRLQDLERSGHAACVAVLTRGRPAVTLRWAGPGAPSAGARRRTGP